MNYIVRYVDNDTGYTTIKRYPTVKDALKAVSELMYTNSHRYITITTI